jgi:hypothetical protein
MTYKLNPELEKILSPVALIFSDMTRQEYPDGKSVTEAVFNRCYRVESLRAIEGTVEIKLVERSAPEMIWSGEESASFF